MHVCQVEQGKNRRASLQRLKWGSGDGRKTGVEEVI